MSASVVRSAVMLTVYALLSLGHRDKMSVNTLAFAAIVMLLFNPRSLFDIGFQLSFMAVLAILLFYPLFNGVWSQAFLLDHRVFRWGWTMVAVSCAAQIGVAPLIAYYFGRFSNYFLLTNFIVVPAATLILYFSLIVLLIPAFAYLLIYIVDTLNLLLLWMAALPGASIEGLHPTLLQMLMIYVIIGAVYLLLTRKTSPTAGWSTSNKGW
jgi:competence protein ComEC